MKDLISVLIVLSFLPIISSYTVVSNPSSVQVVNNVTKTYNTVHVKCSDLDGENQFYFDIQTSQQTLRYYLTCGLPVVRYSATLRSYVPFAQELVQIERCLIDGVPDQTGRVNATLGYFSQAGGFALQSKKIPPDEIKKIMLERYGHLEKKNNLASNNVNLNSLHKHGHIEEQGILGILGLAGGFLLGGPLGLVAGGLIGGMIDAGLCQIGGVSKNGFASDLFGCGGPGGGGGDCGDCIHAGEFRQFQQDIFGNVSLVNANLLNYTTTADQKFSTLDKGFTLLNGSLQNIYQFQQATAQSVNNVNAILQNFQLQDNLFQNYTTYQFQQVQGVLTSLTNSYGSIGAAVNILYNQTQAQLAITQSQISQLFNKLNTNYNILNSLIRKRDLRRLLIDGFQQALNTTSWIIGLQMDPFLYYLGSRPMTWAQKAALKDIAKTEVLADIHIQYTENVGGGVYRAHDTEIQYRCELTYALNNTQFLQGVYQVLSSLGPATSTPCYSGNATNQYACFCVMEVVDTTCVLSNNNFNYPFRWTSVESSLASHSQRTTYCNNGGQTGTTVVTVAQSSIQLETYLNTLCSTNLLSSVMDTTGNHVRLYQNGTGAYRDFRHNLTDFQSVTTMCSASYMGMLNAGSSTYTDNLSTKVLFGFYVYLMFSVQDWVWYSAPLKEITVYGQMANGLAYSSKPFSQFASIMNSPDCERVAFTRVSSMSNAINGKYKLPLYAIQYETTTPTIQVQVGSYPIADTSGNAVFPASSVGSIYTGNVTFTTDASTIIPDSRWLPGNDVLYLDTQDSTFIADVPFSEFHFGGSAITRCNAVNYNEEPNFYNDTTPTSSYNMTRFMAFENVDFDPYCAANSPSNYYRKLVTTGIPGQKVCDVPYFAVSLFSQGFQSNTTYDYDICTMLKKALFQFNGVAGTFLVYPLKFNYDTYIEVPAGTLILRVNSECPSGYNVTVANGRPYVTLYTASLEVLSVRVVVTSNSSTLGCLTNAVFTYSASHPISLTTLSLCGQQYIQVYSIDTNAPCYIGAGISLASSSRFDGLVSVDSPIQLYVARSVAEAQYNAAYLLNSVTNLYNYAILTALTQTDPLVYNTNLQAQVNQTLILIQNITVVDPAYASTMNALANNISGLLTANNGIYQQLQNYSILLKALQDAFSDNTVQGIKETATLVTINRALNTSIISLNVAMQAELDWLAEVAKRQGDSAGAGCDSIFLDFWCVVGVMEPDQARKTCGFFRLFCKLFFEVLSIFTWIVIIKLGYEAVTKAYAKWESNRAEKAKADSVNAQMKPIDDLFKKQQERQMEAMIRQMQSQAMMETPTLGRMGFIPTGSTSIQSQEFIPTAPRQTFYSTSRKLPLDVMPLSSISTNGRSEDETRDMLATEDQSDSD